MKKQIVFYDSEFTGLRQDAEFISICFIGRNKTGKKIFYAEFNDYDQSKIDDWLKENVISNLVYNDKETFYQNRENKIVYMKDNTERIKEELIKYFALFDEVEIWSDCLAYDWVLFNNIFGSAFDIPSNIYYIPFDICTLMKVKGIDPDINREEFSEYMSKDYGKHNALHDAFVISKCYEKLIQL